MNKDLAAGLGLFAIAAGYYWAATDIPVSTLEDEFGPRGLPTVLAGVLAVLSVALMARSLLTAPNVKKPKDDDDEAEAPWPRAMGMLALGALYIPLASTIGYPLALFMLLAAVMLYEGMKPSPAMLAVAVGGAAFFWFLFAYVLGVRQPEGILF
jgi:putative tricarboxylic transport membrane protein